MSCAAVFALPGRLAAVEAALDGWCDGLAPAVLSGPDAVDGLKRVSVVIRRLTAAQTGLAGRVADTNSWRGTSPNAAVWIAVTLGVSMADAHRMLQTGKRLGSCPVADAAFKQGDLSLSEAEQVSLAAEADPSSEAAMVGTAKKTHDLRDTRDKSDKIRRGVHDAKSETERAAKIHAGRRWRPFTDPHDG